MDAAIIETDGETILGFGPTSYCPYKDDERPVLREALAAAVSLTDRTSRPGVIGEAEELTTRTHAEVVERFMAERGIAPGDITVVGFHGQTVIHKPADRLTIQIGDGGGGLAKRLGIPVVHDFRQADVRAGGQGAPLMPVFHRAIVHTIDRATSGGGRRGDPVAAHRGSRGASCRICRRCRAPESVVVVARNATLMTMLADKLAPATVETADQAGFSADALEAQAFAFLAVRAMRGLPITFPTTSGAPKPMAGGVMVMP